MAPPHNLETSPIWAQYGAVLTDVDLHAVHGMLPRRVVLLDDGDLLVSDAYGQNAFITDLTAGYVHDGACRYLKAGQTARTVVYW